MSTENVQLRTSDMLRMLERVCQAVEEENGRLSKLDAACGDGDHGVSMARGFRVVEERLAGLAEECPGTVFRKVGMTLVTVIGGATGPLMGTLFLEAGKAAGDCSDVNAGTLAAMFRAGLDSVCQRGKAKPGDKTMVDALVPAVEALEVAASEGRSPAQALKRAANAAREGADATAAMVARQGRARYLGERAVGHQDAGANSIALVFRAMAEAASEDGNVD